MKERWKPEIGEAYYFIDSSINVDIERYDGHTWDDERIAIGNYFNTKEEALAAAEKVKALLLSLHDSTQDKPLPKLTAEVFNHPDCPAWANYAAVHNGNLIFTNQEPRIDEHGLFVSANNAAKPDKILVVPFKSSEHYLSQVIKRPVKENKLPDWCKVGEWVYDRHQHGYEKIIATEDGSLYCIKTKNNGFFTGDYATENFVPARLRPYNAEEMRQLVGKMVEKGDGLALVLGIENVFGNEYMVCVNGHYFSANDLLRQFTINNKPAGVLEHLENGEWVQ